MTSKLVHVTTQSSFELPDKLGIVLIGKKNEQQIPDVDLSGLPAADIISRRHAQIYIQPDAYFLEDLGSANGTYLNQQRLQPHTLYVLSPGDQIQLGQGQQIGLIFHSADKMGAPAKASPQPSSSQTALQVGGNQPSASRAGRLLGLGLMTLAIVWLAAGTRIGIFVGLPALALGIIGFVLLVQKRYSPIWGWGLIGGGLALAIIQGGFLASVNLLSLLVNGVLFLVGYQLYSGHPIFNTLVQSLRDLFKI